jgi:hypothetical protein
MEFDDSDADIQGNAGQGASWAGILSASSGVDLNSEFV